MMKKSMTADIRAKAGLGNPPEKFYTNDSETNNERKKHKMEHREAGLCSFVVGMKQLAYSQETEFAKVMCGMSSKFKVRDVFSSFLVPASKWYDMREDQRQSYVLRIYKLAISVKCMLKIHNIVYTQAAVMSNSPVLALHQNTVALEVLSLCQC